MLRSSRPWVFALLLGTGLVAGPSLGERSAAASAAIALTLDDLVVKSDVVAVGTATARTARWEDGKIVTYTTITVDQALGGGAAKGDTLVVRTLGGVVGTIGQKVHGEAVLPVGGRFVLFLRALPAAAASAALPGARSVTGMEQGALPIVVDADKAPRIGPSGATLTLVPTAAPKDVPASVATAGRKLDDVVGDVKSLWTTHGKK